MLPTPLPDSSQHESTPPPTPPPTPRPPSGMFAFEAQAEDGQRISGTIDAPDADAVMDRLQGMGLRVINVARVEATPGAGPDASTNGGAKPSGPAAGGGAGAAAGTVGAGGRRPLKADDFAAFNQQFAQLTRAGLPVEHGLRLIAGDMRRGRLARTIGQVAEELERGTPLGEAFDKHRGQFPTLYGRLVDAGVRGGDLPGVLLGLGRHLELVQRLRAALWRSVSYPLMVFVGLCLVLIFLGLFVLPQFQDIFEGLYGARRSMGFTLSGRPPAAAPVLPLVTRLLMVLTSLAPLLLVLIIAVVVGGPLVWAVLRTKGKDREVLDRLVLPLPLVGPVLRLNLVARWCDALRLGVATGLDLPASIDLAGDVTGSPALRHDGRGLVALLESGRPLSTPRPDNKLLPATVPAAIDLASGHHDLPGTLETLSDMYERQAESRLASLPAIITPLLVILVAGITAFVIAGLLLPMVRALGSL